MISTEITEFFFGLKRTISFLSVVSPMSVLRRQIDQAKENHEEGQGQGEGSVMI